MLEELSLVLLVDLAFEAAEPVFHVVLELCRPIELAAAVFTTELPVLVMAPHMVL